MDWQPATLSESSSVLSAASQSKQYPTPIPGLESESTDPEPLPSLVPGTTLQARALQMLLHVMQGPQQTGADGTVHPGCSILYYQPFSTTDLSNWRSHTLPYSE
jgi:hypothetical protein